MYKNQERKKEMIRKLDNLGRFVIPVEIRKSLKLKAGDEMKIEQKGEKITIFKSKDTFCPNCLKRCMHTDNFCSNCGLDFKSLRKE